MITLAIRFDDPSVTSNRSVEEIFIAALVRWQLKATFAAIPFRHIDGQPVRLYRQHASHIARAVEDGHVEVALHGHSHVRRSQTPGGRSSEFWGVRPAVQETLVAEGLGVLQEIFGNVISGFVPPWNTYDRGTLAAAKAASLRYVSADVKTAGGGLLLPRTCRMVNVRRAIAEARRFADASCVIVAVAHHYDFAQSRESAAAFDSEALDSLFQWLAEQSDVRVDTLAGLAARTPAAQLARGIALRRLRDRMPQAIARALPAESIMLTPLQQLGERMRGLMRMRARPA